MFINFPNIIRSPLSAAVILIILIGGVYFSALHHDFVQWDDDVLLLDNLSIRNIDGEHLARMFTERKARVYVPLTTLSFALEHHYFGYDPFVYHLNNIVLHIGICLFIFLFARRIGCSDFTAFFGALIFGIHPMHVESVAWVTERKDVLYSFFYMAALVFYLKHLKRVEQEAGGDFFYLGLTYVCGLLSVLAKPMAVSLPLILFLLDWFDKRKFSKESVFEKLPLFIIVGVVGWFTYSVHARNPVGDPLEAVLIWAWTFTFYLRQFLFPLLYVPIYHLPEPVVFSNISYLLSMAAVVFIAFSLICFRRFRFYLFATGFYFFSVFFLLRYDLEAHAAVVSDRFMYLPSLGFCLLLAAGITRLLSDKPHSQNKTVKIVVSAALVLMLSALAWKTNRQIGIWKNTATLWQHQLKYNPNDPIALNNFALYLRGQSPYKEAEGKYLKLVQLKMRGYGINTEDNRKDIETVEYLVSLFEKAVFIKPDYTEAHFNLGQILRDIGRYPEALEQYKKVTEMDPSYPNVYYGLGDLQRFVGNIEKAIVAYSQYIAHQPDAEDAYMKVILTYQELRKLNPSSKLIQSAQTKVLENFIDLINRKTPQADLYLKLGYIYSSMGDLHRAASAYQMGLDINPHHKDILFEMGNINKLLGRYKEAIGYYEKFVEASPDNAKGHLNIGIIYAGLKDYKQSKEYLETARRKDPHNAQVYFNFALVNEIQNNLTEALKYYKKAAELNPDNPEIFYHYAATYDKLENYDKAREMYLKVTELNPQRTKAWVNLSHIAYKQQDYANAIKFLDEARILGYDPNPEYMNALEAYR